MRAFRNLEFVELLPDPGLNMLVGENAQGKTSTLEAIHLAS
ncbi:AAA family ATPase, partial [Acinetobacter baumannii]